MLLYINDVNMHMYVHVRAYFISASVTTDYFYEDLVLQGSISAAFMSPVYFLPREETGGRVSGKACLWRKFLIKILAVHQAVRNVIWWQSLAGSHDAYGS